MNHSPLTLGFEAKYPYLMKDLKLDKTAFSLGKLDDSEERRAYWHSRTPAERLAAMEQLRRIN